MKLNENQKVTLTVGQLKKLVSEARSQASTNDSLWDKIGDSDNDDFEIKDGVLVEYNGKGGDVVIPDGVTEIGVSVFSMNDNVKSVTIPNSVTKINAHAFSDCNNMRSVTIPNSVKSIGLRAFSSCIRLKSIAIPDSVTIIDEKAFSYCYNLESVAIGSGVTEIGKDAFYGSNKISDVKLSNPRLANAFAHTPWAESKMNGGNGHNNIYFKLGNGKTFSLVGLRANWRAGSEWSNIADAVCRYFKIDRKEYAKIIRCIQENKYYSSKRESIYYKKLKTSDESGNIYDYISLTNGPSRSWFIYFDERAESCIGETTSLKTLIKMNGFRLPSAFKFNDSYNRFEYERNTNYGHAGREFVGKCVDALEKAGWTQIDRSMSDIPDGSASSTYTTLLSPDGKVKFMYSHSWRYMSSTDSAMFFLNDDKKSSISESTKVTLTIGQLKKLIKESFK